MHHIPFGDSPQRLEVGDIFVKALLGTGKETTAEKERSSTMGGCVCSRLRVKLPKGEHWMCLETTKLPLIAVDRASSDGDHDNFEHLHHPYAETIEMDYKTLCIIPESS